MPSSAPPISLQGQPVVVAPAPPLQGPHGEDAHRIDYTRRARRILYGEHQQDVHEHMKGFLPDVRIQAWPPPDLSSNPYKQVWTALSTLYDRAPIVTSTTGGGGDELAARCASQGLWAMMSRVQRDTLALREMWVRVSVAPQPGMDGVYDPVFEPVFPDHVIAVASPDRPTEPHTVWHARRYGREWLWDHVSIADPAAPVYRVVRRSGDELEDVSAAYGVSGWPDAWRDSAGRPVMPYVLYHAARTGYIYDPYATIELVRGTLTVAMLKTFVAHVASRASWRQRFGIDVMPVGAENAVNRDGTVRSRMVLDPATIAMFQRIDAESNPQLGTLEVPVLPGEIWSYIEGLIRALLGEAGINPADLMALHGDARSGYALAVSRDAQREAQRRYEPQFRAGDLELLRVAACQLNRVEGASYPEGGYRVAYQGIPLSSQERDAQRRHLLELLDAGLMDPVEAWQELHPGATYEQAIEGLRRMATVREEVAGPAADVQATALNGAQATALVDMAQRVALGQLPADAALAAAMVAFPGVPEQQIRAVFGSLGAFRPRPEGGE